MMTHMPSTFPHERRGRLGYDPDEVDRFITMARAEFDRPTGAVRAADVRRTAFTMKRGGYTSSAVDSALERLEDERLVVAEAHDVSSAQVLLRWGDPVLPDAPPLSSENGVG